MLPQKFIGTIYIYYCQIKLTLFNSIHVLSRKEEMLQSAVQKSSKGFFFLKLLQIFRDVITHPMERKHKLSVPRGTLLYFAKDNGMCLFEETIKT